MVLKIAFIGSEGSGKTFVTKFFTKFYQTVSAEEYGSWYCKNKLPSYLNEKNIFNTQKKDFLKIITEQKKIWKQTILEAESKKLSICFFDTDIIYTKYFVDKQFPNWKKIEKFCKDQPIDFFIFIKSKKIFFKTDAIINPKNAQKEIKILLNMYLERVSKKLIIIQNNDPDTLISKLKKVLKKLLLKCQINNINNNIKLKI